MTGATGLLGRYLVDVLVESGASVRAYVRRGSDTRRLVGQGVALVTGDEGDRPAMRRAVEGVDVIFHLAGYLTAAAPFTVEGQNDAAGEWDRYQAVNVDFTRALLEAGLAAGAGRFVFVSSNSVYAADAPVPTPEGADLRPISAYGRSKLLAEREVFAFQEKGLDGTIIRPSLVYGIGDRYFTPLALRLARLPVLPLVNGGRSLLDLVYARDVAELMWLAASREGAAGRVYNAGPGRPTSLSNLVAAYRRVTGKGPRIVPVSAGMAGRTAWLSRRLLSPLLHEAEVFLSPAGIALMDRDLHLSMERAEAELNYRSRYDLLSGLEETIGP